VEEMGCQVGDISFSAKELQLIRLMSREMSAREMAREMFLSERTIEQYKFRIARKMGVKNMVGIIRYAIKHGLLKTDEL
jgi:DNA-binding NarL/FixJ family response regulator